jgi:predicted dehydrogenase/threonine dehydrogenase-like Zn-dependent dehydrogenase
MKQVLQPIDSGATRVEEIPAPICGPREVLIANEASLISAGTEKMIVELARKSLLGKARERPDQVRRVLQKLKQEGVRDTIQQVRAKLAEPMSLGYSSAGVVIEAGREVGQFRPGDRVASNGPHAGVVAVPQNLVARVPAGMAFEEACYGVVGAIALQGVRLAKIGVGDRVAVIGLGLIGQIAIMLLRASGCIVIGTDPDEAKCQLAIKSGAEAGAREEFVSTLLERTNGHGADAVLITASTPSNEPLELAATVARKKARVVAIGAVGLSVPRREFYPKELELIVSCSYGPGRYDASYEEQGLDYPYSYVRWTEQRNIEAVLEQIAEKRIDAARLTTHTFDVTDAERAYHLIETGSEPFLGIVLNYPRVSGDLASERRVVIRSEPSSRPLGDGEVGVGFIGAGNFASLVLLPALNRIPGLRPRVICSAGGVSAVVRGERHGFEVACTALDDVLTDPAVNAVIVATRHNLHSEQALAALRSGKNVFVEKPLAIDADQLTAFEEGLTDFGTVAPIWTVGFNRRFSPAAQMVREFFSSLSAPVTLTYRFNAGAIPAQHWTQDLSIGGGRLVGEACHALDLACFLVGGQIMRVFAESVEPGGAAGSGDDQTTIIARMDNGSVASIGYFAGGDKGFPKERIEIFGGGRVGVIDDFKAVILSKEGRIRTHKFSRRDKGHDAEIAAFFSAVRSGGPPPIPYHSLLNVSWAALAIMESLRTGLPVSVKMNPTD